MRCTSPRTVGFKDDGKTISWSKKQYSKEYPTFKLPCTKCIECRMEYARSWAVRCVHESKMHKQNSFITLTYSDTHLKSPRLQYSDFQLFAKRLRQHIFKTFLSAYGEANWALLDKEERKKTYEPHKISILVTGEYGTKTKRPHWHAIIFNWRPSDLKSKYRSPSGDQVYDSTILTDLWGQGITEVGSVTKDSAGYVARYSLKDLEHGYDGTHDFKSISKKSSHSAIGKKYIEKFYADIFNYGELILDDGTSVPIPRYYEKWYQKHHPEKYLRYVTEIKYPKSLIQQTKADEEEARRFAHNLTRSTIMTTPEQTRSHLSKQRRKKLAQHLKG